MKIDPQSTIQAPALTRPNQARTSAPAGGDHDGDVDAAGSGSGAAATVELSERARELHAALQAAQQAPDVRPEHVADAKQRLADGSYQVKPDQIASRLLDRKA